MQILPQGQQRRFELLPPVTNDDCIFCDGRGGQLENLAYGPGIEDPQTTFVPCKGCRETGKDDPQLYEIMTGRLVPPVCEVEL
jgi:hypothetical protein